MKVITQRHSVGPRTVDIGFGMYPVVRSPRVQAFIQLELPLAGANAWQRGNRVSSPRQRHAPEVVQPLLRQGVVSVDMVPQSTTLE